MAPAKAQILTQGKIGQSDPHTGHNQPIRSSHRAQSANQILTQSTVSQSDPHTKHNQPNQILTQGKVSQSDPCRAKLANQILTGHNQPIRSSQGTVSQSRLSLPFRPPAPASDAWVSCHVTVLRTPWAPRSTTHFTGKTGALKARRHALVSAERYSTRHDTSQEPLAVRDDVRPFNFTVCDVTTPPPPSLLSPPSRQRRQERSLYPGHVASAVTDSGRQLFTRRRSTHADPLHLKDKPLKLFKHIVLKAHICLRYRRLLNAPAESHYGPCQRNVIINTPSLSLSTPPPSP